MVNLDDMCYNGICDNFQNYGEIASQCLNNKKNREIGLNGKRC